ncbi:TonB-dependent receptor [Mangrovimicrobium sediminis]|uniref:TonB-dependent receptor n=1 Tax=Mangrovimicrobium sediminis TaxID=2562682 RepID=A0A4Z0M8S9_9GAMM|nr:TonB-dependent receptor [Haliea sp. SAOS-164]TGD75788.1 TonB-dependent receptor [Haliea sp. SAOS-164]
MKRLIPIAAALVAARAAAEQLPIEHVLVTVPLHKKTAETALPITVLSGDELHRAASATIGDTLANQPGLANASFGPGVGQPVIRGQQGARVTVLQNGTTAADASALSADHAVSVEPLLADSIEVLRGPATLLYGGGAIGGVINVLDNRVPTTLPDAPSGGIEYRRDTASDMDNVVGRLEAATGDFAWHFDGLYRDWSEMDVPGNPVLGDDERDERGTLQNSDGQTRSATLGSSYHFGSGFVGLAVSRLENEYGIPPGAHGHHHDEELEGEHDEELEGDHDEEHEDEHGEEGIRIDLEQTRYDAALHLHEPLPGLEVMRGFVSYTDYEHAEIEGNGEVGTRYTNESWEARLEAVHQPWGPVHGVFGLQVLDGRFSAIGEEAFIPVTDRREAGLFLLEDYHLDDWLFEVGLRLDRDERDPRGGAPDRDFTAFSASGSAVWSLSPAWQFGLALSRAERAPAIEELYSNTGITDPEAWVVHAATNAIELGNDDLDTEVSANLDLSVDWYGDDNSVSVTVFYNDFSDYIGLLATGQEVDEVPVYGYAQEDAQFYGVEVESDFRLASLAGGELRLGVFGDTIRGELDGGADVPRLPPMRVGARLGWSDATWDVWTQVLDAADQDRPGENEEETAGYTRWDAGVQFSPTWGGTDLQLFARLNNITDEEIRLSTSFLREVAPEAGRGVEAGVRLVF